MVIVRVLVADEQTLFREGVCALLKLHEDIEIVGEAANGKETIEMVREQAPDVVLMNMAMPVTDGAEVAHRIRRENNSVKVLFLTEYENEERILIRFKSGANGYIPKRVTASELVSAVKTVHRGDYFLHPSVAKTVVDHYFQRTRQPETPDPYDRLTDRERLVLKLIVEGRKSREIANLLHIAVKTVLGYRARMMRKLGIHNQAELVKYAIRKHLITLDN